MMRSINPTEVTHDELKDKRNSMGRQENIENQVRVRLASALSAAGVDFGRVSLEVLYLLPADFLDAYIELYFRALKDASAVPADSNAVAVGKKHRHHIGPAIVGTRYKEYWQIRDAEAFEKKRKIDKKLVRLIGDIRRNKEDENKHRVRCKGNNSCGRWIAKDWIFCAWCGNELGK